MCTKRIWGQFACGETGILDKSLRSTNGNEDMSKKYLNIYSLHVQHVIKTKPFFNGFLCVCNSHVKTASKAKHKQWLKLRQDSCSKNDFQTWRQLNPYFPHYILFASLNATCSIRAEPATLITRVDHHNVHCQTKAH